MTSAAADVISVPSVDHGAIIAVEPQQIRGIWAHVSLPQWKAEETQLRTLVRTSGESCLMVRRAKSFLNFPHATQHLAAMAVSELAMKDDKTFVFYGRGFQLFAPTQCWEMKDADLMCFHVI